MARIAGVNVPDNKHTEIALTSVYGIGKVTAQKICATVGVNQSTKIKDLKRIRYTTSHPQDFTDDLSEVHGKCEKLMPLINLKIKKTFK